MIIALTGTPGTGKSTVSRLVDAGFGVVDLNELIRDRYNLGTDPERGSVIADLDGLTEYTETLKGDNILEGHVAHFLPADVVIVLRTAPGILRARLSQRGWSKAKIDENVEAEALDVILVEALEMSDHVFEIDGTEMTLEQIADAIREIAGGTDRYKPGSVDFSGELCP